MNIVVCMKRVPDTATKIRINSDGTGIDESGIEYVINPYDEYAIEAGLQLKEKFGGEVVILTLDSSEAAPVVRNALAMGADRAVILKCDKKPVDSLSTATALAEGLKALNPDVILMGKQGVDYDNSQVGPMVGQLLGIPCVSVITKLEVSDGKAVANRQIEGGEEVVEVELPAIFTAQKGLNEPRYASLKGIMAAKKKKLDEQEAQIPEGAIEVIKMEIPPAREGGKIVGEGADAVPELVKLLQFEAKVL
ncbi:MAG: electron transfer flavoprotein beta subunit/FixA family protein [Candidatus Schekmanbacteria bacterium]|nr:MAG: electron transfer flavoprotein beta subunit/FixA family protein [Candidatus Schekmanbacteria bacterium]